jgi:hypothetical protein
VLSDDQAGGGFQHLSGSHDGPFQQSLTRDRSLTGRFRALEGAATDLALPWAPSRQVGGHFNFWKNGRLCVGLTALSKAEKGRKAEEPRRSTHNLLPISQPSRNWYALL